MKYDETELVEFFGVLPSEQDPEEKEFFRTTNFDCHQDRYHLSVSFSTYRDDFYLDLKDIGRPGSILELQIEEVYELKVRRDKPTSAPVLLVRARVDDDESGKEVRMQSVEITLEPNVRIRWTNLLA